jgi:DNA-binding beta-propeller fold protein YncE
MRAALSHAAGAARIAVRRSISGSVLASILGALGCDRAADPQADAAREPRREQIYVSQAGSSTVAVLDASSGALVRRLDVGMLPHGFVLSRDGRRLYVAVVGSQVVAEIDTASAQVRRTLATAPVPAQREDGSTIEPHVTQDAFSHVTCYDCHRPDGAKPKHAGDRPFGLLLSPDGTHLLVSHLRSGRLSDIDLASGRIVRTVLLAPAGPASEAVALARLGDEIWVVLRPPQPSMKAGALRRLNATTLATLGPDEPTGSDPSAMLALGGRSRVLVSNFETNTVTEHDRNGARTVHVVSPGPLGLVDLEKDRVLAIDYYSNAVSFVDLRAGTSQTVALRRGDVPYANPTNGALAGDGRTVWLVASGTDGHLLQLDLATHEIVRDLPIDGLSFGIAVVPAHLY